MARPRGRSAVPFRAPPPWWARQAARVIFESGLLTAYPTIRRIVGPEGPQYRGRLDVPHYEARTATVHVTGYDRIVGASVLVDGPTQSPHRYRGGYLCMWEEEDPPAMCWLPSDGLVALLDHVRLHLFREAWWRETGRWSGPQAPHRAAPSKGEAA
jgi:hypothetical protein